MLGVLAGTANAAMGGDFGRDGQRYSGGDFGRDGQPYKWGILAGTANPTEGCVLAGTANPTSGGILAGTANATVGEVGASVMSMSEQVEMIRERMAGACARAGRGADEVRLVAVSKTYPPESVCEAVDCGLTVFGESRVYEAEAKIPACPSVAEWELIGHLQRNKVRRAVQLFSMLHAVDTLALLARIDSCSKEIGKSMPVCLEVNVSGEGSKYGFSPDAIPSVLEEATALLNVDVVGVMTIPPFTPDAEGARPHLRRLRELRDEWSTLSGFELQELSMGMSGDFEVAIEEGATCVRVGSAIFGARA